MPKAGFYAVAKGRVPGIYTTWDECQQQVNGVLGNKHKKFPTMEQALAYLSQHGVSASGFPAIASGSSPATHTPPVKRKEHSTKPYSKSTLASAKSKTEKKTSTSGSSRWAALTTEVIEDESGWDVVFSDGACKGNGKQGSVAGIGVWWGPNDARNIAERCPGGQTNNRAELIAIVRVLETVPHTKQPLLIVTDSKYSISCFREWMPKWLINGFKTSAGQAVKNAPLIRYLSALLDQRAREGQKVHLQYVKGHAGIEGNEGADMMANVGATLPEEPERDWEALLANLQESLDKSTTKSTPMVLPSAGIPKSELEEYAEGLADDDELLAEVMA